MRHVRDVDPPWFTECVALMILIPVAIGSWLWHLTRRD